MKMKTMIKKIDHINRPRLYVDTNELNIKSIWVRWFLYALCNNLCPSPRPRPQFVFTSPS